MCDFQCPKFTSSASKKIFKLHSKQGKRVKRKEVSIYNSRDDLNALVEHLEVQRGLVRAMKVQTGLRMGSRLFRYFRLKWKYNSAECVTLFPKLSS